jgi:plastocyanin
MSDRSLGAAAVLAAALLPAAASAGTVTGSLKVSGTAEAQRTVVYVEAMPEGSFSPPAAVVRLSQRGAAFNPGVLPVVQGTRVDLTNDDWVAHNVFSKSAVKTFDLGLYAQDKGKVLVFDRVGAVPVFCSIHPRMNAVILVLQNPFFTKPDPSGHFKLDGLPAGTYALKVFRKEGTEAKTSVIVPASGSVEVQF